MATEPRQEQLLALFQLLTEPDRHALLSYAEFLVQRTTRALPPTAVADVPSPQHIPPVEGESVVAAIKRLRASYPMLSRRAMLDKVAVLMSEHMIHGRERLEVIVELESVFAEQYRVWSEAATRADQ